MLEGDKPFIGSLDIGLNFIRNVNDILQTNNNANLHYYYQKHHLMSLTAYNLNMVNGKRFISDGYQHFRYGYKISDVFTFEYFTQLQYNDIIKLKSRYLNAAGGRVKIIDKDSIRLFVGSLYLFEREMETTPKLNLHHRLSNYISFGTHLTNNLNFDLMIYYQPDINKINDYRFSGEGVLEMQFTRRLGFRVIGSWFYDSYPPVGVRNAFFSFRNALRYKF